MFVNIKQDGSVPVISFAEVLRLGAAVREKLPRQSRVPGRQLAAGLRMQGLKREK